MKVFNVTKKIVIRSTMIEGSETLCFSRNIQNKLRKWVVLNMKELGSEAPYHNIKLGDRQVFKVIGLSREGGLRICLKSGGKKEKGTILR